MAFSSKQENDYDSQLEQIAAEVDSYIVKTDGVLEYFREQIRPLAQRWKTYREAVDKRKKELSDHWEKVKKNPKLQDKSMNPSEGWEWDRFYLHGLGGLSDSNPINEMPAKHAPDVMASLEKYLERNKKNEQGYPENSSEYKRLQGAIAEQRQNLEDIRSEFDNLSPAEQKTAWIKTPPKTVIPNITYVKFTWWRYLNLEDENVFGCWRPPLIPLPEYPLNILKPVEPEYCINQTRKELPDAKNQQEEYERYYIFLSSVHDNYLQGVEKITEGIWLDNLQIAVLCCLDKGHGDKTTFLKAALARVCQSNHKTDKKIELTVTSETRTDKCIKKIKNHPIISIIIIIGIVIIAFGAVVASLDNILSFWDKIVHSSTESADIFADVSKDGSILRSKNFPWKINKNRDDKNNVTYIIVGRYGDSSAASVIPDNSRKDYIVYNSMSGVAVKFTCPEEEISNFTITLKSLLSNHKSNNIN